MRRYLGCTVTRPYLRCSSFAAGLFHFKVTPGELFPYPVHHLGDDEGENLVSLTGKISKGEKAEGLSGARIAPEYGGLGLGNTAFGFVCEELGRNGLGNCLPAIQSSSFPVHFISSFGSKEQKGNHFTKISDETETFGWAMQEGNGADVSMNTTKARLENNKFYLTGKKLCRLAEKATRFLVMARTSTQVVTEDGPQNSERSAVFIVARDAKGVSLLGDDLILEDAEVEEVVGTVGDGFKNQLSTVLTEQYAYAAALLGTLKGYCEEVVDALGEDWRNNLIASCLCNIYGMESALYAVTANLDRKVDDLFLELSFTNGLIYHTVRKCAEMLSTLIPISASRHQTMSKLLELMEHPDYLYAAAVSSELEAFGLKFQATSTLQIMQQRTMRGLGFKEKLPVQDVEGSSSIDAAIVNFGNAVETTFVQNTTSVAYQQLLLNRLGEAGQLLYASSASASRASLAQSKKLPTAKMEKELAAVFIAGATKRVNQLCHACRNRGQTAEDISRRIALELCNEAAQG